jgi:5-(carboxyamino)imidazole ribonucleotide synthase
LHAVLDYGLGATAPVVPLAVMANVLGAPETPAMTMDERLHHLFGRIRHARVHMYGKRNVRQGRTPGSQDRASQHPRGATAHRRPAVVAKVCERAERRAHALAGFVIPFEVGVVSAHRTPDRMLDYARGPLAAASR